MEERLVKTLCLLLILVSLPAMGDVASLRSLYEQMEYEARIQPTNLDLPAYSEQVHKRLMGLEASVFELRAMIVEIYQRIAADPRASSAVKTMQSQWLLQLAPANEALVGTIKQYLKHEFNTVRWMALMQLRGVYQSGPKWQMLALEFYQETTKRVHSRRGILSQEQQDKVEEDLMLGHALLSMLVRSEIPLIPALAEQVILGFSGMSHGTLGLHLMNDLRLSNRTAQDRTLQAISRSVVDQARAVLKTNRAQQVSKPYLSSTLRGALEILVKITLEKKISDPQVLSELRIFVDEPSFPRWTDEATRLEFVTYYDSLNLRVVPCQILLFPAPPVGE